MSVRTEAPLAFALGVFVGSVGTVWSFIGGEVVAHVMHWRGQRV